MEEEPGEEEPTQPNDESDEALPMEVSSPTAPPPAEEVPEAEMAVGPPDEEQVAEETEHVEEEEPEVVEEPEQPASEPEESPTSTS